MVSDWFSREVTSDAVWVFLVVLREKRWVLQSLEGTAKIVGFCQDKSEQEKMDSVCPDKFANTNHFTEWARTLDKGCRHHC